MIAAACVRIMLVKAVSPRENTCEVWLAGTVAFFFFVRERMVVFFVRSFGVLLVEFGRMGCPFVSELLVS